jgi:hypothetical protein
MRLLAFFLLLFLVFSVACFFGAAGQGMAANFLVLAVMIGGANFFLSRKACLWLSGISLLVGTLGSVGVWTFGGLLIKGDSSGYGMLGTLLAVILIPIGLALAVLGWSKNN